MKKNLTSLISIFVMVLFFSAVVFSQTTEFTYQGRLLNASTPATGNYDFEFALFDALTAGSQIGSTLNRSSVAVADGNFSVALDFGSQFPGESRFLEIRVRPTGGGAFTPLLPRQPVNSTPYAVKSVNADNAVNATQLGGIAAGQYVLTGDARLFDARAPTAGSANYIQNQNAAPQASSNFNISGTGTANILNATTQYNIGGSRVFSVAGTENVFAGVGAGSANTTGAFNSFFGTSAGFSNTSGRENSFFGRSAGLANTTGIDNSFFGRNSGSSNTTGYDNSFFGRNAGFSNTTGVSNSFFGRSAGNSNTTGGDNSFFGHSAGDSNTTGGDNSFFGRSAGFSNTTGVSNSFFGRDSGASNTTGDANSFFGRGAGYNNTTGGDNSFFGRAAGQANTIGFYNAFFGDSAGEANTTGNSNSFFGLFAGGSNTTGGANSFFGRGAGYNNTTGSNNTIIGDGANVGSGDLSYATAIGSGAVVSTSNTIALGRSSGGDTVVVYGLGAAGATTLCRNASNQISTCSSSLRYKTNVSSFGYGLDLVKRLKPITYDWKDGGMHDLGLGAEDVAAIEPLLVTYNKDGQIEGVKYDRVGVVLINAVKEQQSQIEEQQRMIREQQLQIGKLEKQVDELKSLAAETEKLKRLICSLGNKSKLCN